MAWKADSRHLPGKQGATLVLMVAAAAISSMLLPTSAQSQVGVQVEAPPESSFGIEDYFKVHNITDLTMSSDGIWLAYVTEKLSLENDPGPRRVHLLSEEKDRTSISPEALADAASLAWIPGTQELGFLSPRSGSLQLHSYNVRTGEVQQRTRSTDPVVSFRFAPDGRSFGYATRAPSKPGKSLYDQFRNADEGIRVDPDTLSSHDFVNPDWNTMVDPESAMLWIAQPGRAATRLVAAGEPLGYEGTYFWSSDSRALSVTYIRKDIQSSQLSGGRTSVGIFEVGSNRFRPLAEGSRPIGGRPGVSFAGGEWIPGRPRIILRRVTEDDAWVSDSFPSWAIANSSGSLPGDSSWHPAELYPRGLRFKPTPSQIFVENTAESEHSLFLLKPGGLERSPVVAGLDGSSEQFQFSADMDTVAFVNQSLTRPPEIFLRRGDAPARRVTAVNEDIARQIDFRSREVSWKSKDGLTIKGWLLEPKTTGSGQVRPLVTHVHGGPAFPFPNAFAPYFSFWPFPLEVYAARGMAVFLPNYRGTHSYGRQIATSMGDDQAIEDIVSGVRALIDAGVADPARLGISGHSHGALVGPMAMAKSKIFRASSFAEGASNQVVMYELMSGEANREIHDRTIGVSLYASPQTYIENSADLHLEGVKTASLFEAGAKTSALFMLGLAKAAERFGMPSEFVIYPKTAHNLAIPALQRESATKNLDWFEFWLNGREDSEPSKSEQYKRWRQMK